MGWFLQALATGITTFISTNIDDLVILMLFFSQVNAHFRPHHIVIGQYLGFTALILASLPGFLGGLIVPRQWIGLLGFVPMAIGFYSLVRRDVPEEVQTVSSTREQLLSKRFSILGAVTSLIPPQTYHVSVVTFANGGDNIGIYVPLFASISLASLVVILAVFLLLIGVWCYGANKLVGYPLITSLLTRYGETIVPFVLIGLGLFILFESKSYQLLQR